MVERRQEDRITASWELGELADRVLKEVNSSGREPLSTRELAVQIGLIKAPGPKTMGRQTDDSTLRQCIKFADRAEFQEAQALQKAGVSWRGVVYWLGVKSQRQRNQLYRRMTGGLTNSTEIRAYIKTTFKKKPLPRFSGDCAEDFRKAQKQADSLASVLDALRGSLDKHEDCGSARQRRQLTKALENTRKQINATMRKMRESG